MAGSQARPQDNSSRQSTDPCGAAVLDFAGAPPERRSACSDPACKRSAAGASQPYAGSSAAPSGANTCHSGDGANSRCDLEPGHGDAAFASAQRATASQQGGMMRGGGTRERGSLSRGGSGSSGRRRAAAALVLVLAALCTVLGAGPAAATEINTAVSVFGPWDYELRPDGTSRCAAVVGCSEGALVSCRACDGL